MYVLISWNALKKKSLKIATELGGSNLIARNACLQRFNSRRTPPFKKIKNKLCAETADFDGTALNEWVFCDVL